MWDVKRARRSERRWIYLTVGLLLVPLVLIGALSVVPYAWSWMSWSNQVSSAEDVRDFDAAADGATYDEVVETLGEPLYSGPGFETSDRVNTGVYYWSGDDGEIRGLFMRGRLVGSLKVGVWR